MVYLTFYAKDYLFIFVALCTAPVLKPDVKCVHLMSSHISCPWVEPFKSKTEYCREICSKQCFTLALCAETALKCKWNHLFKSTDSGENIARSRQLECVYYTAATWASSVRGERRSGIRGEHDPGLITTVLSNYSACKRMTGAKAGLMLFVLEPTSPGRPQNDASSLIH